MVPGNDPITKIDLESYEKTLGYLEGILKLLHPFMPFITEELWHQLRGRDVKDALIVSSWPTAAPYNENLINQAAQVFEVVSQIRNIRASKGISPKEAFDLTINTKNQELYESFEAIMKKLGNLENINFGEKVDNALSFVIKSDEFFIPVEDQLDIEKERENLIKELEYTKGFLNSVMKKLGNERFVNNAPSKVIENEKKKQEDAEAKIKALEESLAKLV